MPEPKPDHEDAELALRVYDMRREPVPRTVTRGDHPLNGAYRQLCESNLEGPFLFATTKLYEARG